MIGPPKKVGRHYPTQPRTLGCPDRYSCYSLYGAYGHYGGAAYYSRYSGYYGQYSGYDSRYSGGFYR